MDTTRPHTQLLGIAKRVQVALDRRAATIGAADMAGLLEQAGNLGVKPGPVLTSLYVSGSSQYPAAAVAPFLVRLKPVLEALEAARLQSEAEAFAQANEEIPLEPAPVPQAPAQTPVGHYDDPAPVAPGAPGAPDTKPKKNKAKAELAEANA